MWNSHVIIFSLSLPKESRASNIRVQVFDIQSSSPPRPNHARFHPRSAVVIALLDLTASSHFSSTSSCYHFSSTSSRCLHSSLRLWGTGLIVVSLKSWVLISSFSFSSVCQHLWWLPWYGGFSRSAPATVPTISKSTTIMVQAASLGSAVTVVVAFLTPLPSFDL
ncbi:hypothetical protein Pyn_33657 [Prunus yedoensis var. nudiflora]|uniref:Uncharacterized protein n=1 Tax=Prunus yedoensis var. nudiflora TaxID=2094558 RepID=A0A314YSS1_PRUYE|nr:hypothetical protein Pyn_33657 [Prunus yedoensis var. nudiflora]